MASVRLSAPALLRPGLFLARGQTVGLYGGSFNPLHSGHLHVALAAQRAFGLDRVLFSVAAQNPLKTEEPAALAARFDAVAAAARRHPGWLAVALEAKLRSNYTIDVLKALRRRFPGVRFVVIIGSDNLAQLHRWRRWRELIALAPLAVVARAPGLTRARLSRGAQALRQRWGLGVINAPLDKASSTAIRSDAR